MRKSVYGVGAFTAGSIAVLGLWRYLNNINTSDIELDESKPPTNVLVLSTKTLEQKIIENLTKIKEIRDYGAESRILKHYIDSDKSKENRWEDLFLDKSTQKFYIIDGFIDYFSATINNAKKFTIEDFFQEISKPDNGIATFLENIYGSKLAVEEARLRLEENKKLTGEEYLRKADLERIAISLWRDKGLKRIWERDYRNQNFLKDAVNNYSIIKNQIQGVTLDVYVSNLMELIVSEKKIDPYFEESKMAISLAALSYDLSPTTQRESNIIKLLERDTDVNPDNVVVEKLEYLFLKDLYVFGSLIKRGK